ncbi:hypothetical protein TWF718_007565 [Orbilia javanica]|uniref:Uncharacterized protein n=1 Tax=Orbilia javanica TaxID=47235 RepID=A0AAN8RII8_9PEZI
MKFSTLFTVASAIAMGTTNVSAAPITEAEAITAPAGNLEARSHNRASCRFIGSWTDNEFKVVTWGPWGQDGSWGRGLLDNLRGQCGVITNWEFDYRGRTGVATFKTITINSPKCVQDAIWLASGPTNVGLECRQVSSF